MKRGVIYDVLYGFVPITEWEEKIINSPFFQRLRWIKQLSFANYIFPGAEHNRFGHTIGVMHSMDQMLRALGLAPQALYYRRSAAKMRNFKTYASGFDEARSSDPSGTHE